MPDRGTLHAIVFVILAVSTLAEHDQQLMAAPDASIDQAWRPKPHPRGYVCRKVAAPPFLDGKLQGPGWDEAPWTEEFLDIEGDAKVWVTQQQLQRYDGTVADAQESTQ